MNKENILKSVEAINAQLGFETDNLKRIEAELYTARRERQKWIDRKREKIQELGYLSPLQVGDKVLVKACIRVGGIANAVWEDRGGFISRVKVHVKKDKSLKFEYEVNAMKKDDTMSSKAIRRKGETYYEEQIEKL